MSSYRVPVTEWLDQALAYPGIRLLELTPRIIVESTQLPGTFHRDPADQLISRNSTCVYLSVSDSGQEDFGVSPCTNRALAPQKSKIARATRANSLAADAAPSEQRSGKAGGRPHHPQAQRVDAIVGREVVAKRRARVDLVTVPGPATHHPAGRA